MSLEVTIAETLAAALGPLTYTEFWYGVFITLAFKIQIQKIVGTVLGHVGDRAADKVKSTENSNVAETPDEDTREKNRAM